MSSPTDPQTIKEFTAAAARAELLAKPETWQRMTNTVKAVIAMSNWVATAYTAEEEAQKAAELIRQLGASEPEGWERLRTEFLESARAELLRP